MDRALREFRIRGVKTNIPFLENVVTHPDFQRRRRDDHASSTRRPSCSSSRRAQDRATKLLTLPRRRDRQRQPGREGPQADAAACAEPACRRVRPRDAAAARARASCCRSSARRSSPSGCASRSALLLTDTTFRDAHQSLLATRVRTYDMLRDRERRRAPAAEPVLPGDVGRRDLRHRHAVPAGRPVGAPAPAARGDPEHLFQMLLRGVERGRLHQLSRQRRRASSSRRRPRRASTSSASSTR